MFCAKKLFFFFFLILISSCNTQTNFFPLNEGKMWAYNVEISPGQEEKINYKKTNVAIKKIKVEKNGDKIVVYPIIHENNNIYFYSENNEGIFREAKQFNNNEKIKFESSRKYVLKYPIKNGEKWVSSSKTYLIIRRYAYFDYRATTNFNLNHEISSINEKVQVPAGKFKNCIKVIGNGNTTFIGNREIGTIKINIKTTEWYAPNIGLIKSIREEKTDSDLFGTSKMVQVLEEYIK